MTQPGILDNVIRGWGTQPDATLVGIREEATSAALFRSAGVDRLEVRADADVDRHIVCFQLNSFVSDSWSDDRQFHSGVHRPGGCCVILAGKRPRSVISGAFSILHIYLPVRLVSEAAESLPGGLDRGAVELINPACALTPALQRLGGEVLEELREGSAISRLRVDVLGQELALALLRHHSNLPGTACIGTRRRGGLAPWQVRRTQDAMVAGLDADVGLDELASIAGCSATHFSRAFKQSVGVPPFEWLHQRRMEKAKELLMETALPLAEVALAVGFSAQAQFTTAFGRATGLSPGRWRREQRP